MMTVGAASFFACIESLRDDSIRPPKLQFGDARQIAARDLLRIKAGIDEDLAFFMDEGFFPDDLPNRGRYFSDNTEDQLIELADALRAMRRECAA